MAEYTKVELGRKTYMVVHDDVGIIRIGYVNAVQGQQNLDMTGRVAKAVVRAFEERSAKDLPAMPTSGR